MKPNLLDSVTKKIIIKQLRKKEVSNDTELDLTGFIQSFVKPNLFLIIFFGLCGIFLIYRYRCTKMKRTKSSTTITENVNYADLLMSLYSTEKEANVELSATNDTF